VGGPSPLLDRLTAAQNAHDLEALLACFHDDYASEQPLFPARTFHGIEQVRANWGSVLRDVADFRAELLRSASSDDTVFAEIHWTGTRQDGTPLDQRGVVVLGVRDDRVAWGRLYVDDVRHDGVDIDAVVRSMVGTPDP
jgi:ketosteroid isomerase-like protein